MYLFINRQVDKDINLDYDLNLELILSQLLSTLFCDFGKNTFIALIIFNVSVTLNCIAFLNLHLYLMSVIIAEIKRTFDVEILGLTYIQKWDH